MSTVNSGKVLTMSGYVWSGSVTTAAFNFTKQVGIHAGFMKCIYLKLPQSATNADLRSQVVYSKQPKLGLTQEFVVLLVRMRLVVCMYVCLFVCLFVITCLFVLQAI